MDEGTSGFASLAKKIEAEKRAAKSSPGAPPAAEPMRGDNTKVLRSLVDRIVRLEEEKQGLSADIKVIYIEAKAADFNPRALRVLVKREMEDADQKAAREALQEEVDGLMAALGDFASSPLGESAVSRAR